MLKIDVGILVLALVVLTAGQTSSANEPYFPPEFSNRSIGCGIGLESRCEFLSDFRVEWYSKHLLAAQEPSLYGAARQPPKPGRETLRFTWLRTFDPPVIVRIAQTASARPRLIAKQLSGAGGYEPGTISKRIDRPLTVTEAARLREVVAATDVFTMSPRETNAGLDGAEWIIEGIDEQGYHFISRWSPEQGNVRKLGMFLLTLTGWQFEDVY